MKKNMQAIFAAIEKAVEDAEFKFGRGSGAEKRAFAVSVINALVDVPMLPEWLEQRVIGWGVDLVIYLYNRYWGQRWVVLKPGAVK